VSQLISTQRATVNEHPPVGSLGEFRADSDYQLITFYFDSDSQQHLSIVFLDSLQTNLPSLMSQQQVFTSFFVSWQTIFEAANPVGTASRAAANNPNIAFFI
jgi:hypothetical protein